MRPQPQLETFFSPHPHQKKHKGKRRTMCQEDEKCTAPLPSPTPLKGEARRSLSPSRECPGCSAGGCAAASSSCWLGATSSPRWRRSSTCPRSPSSPADTGPGLHAQDITRRRSMNDLSTLSLVFLYWYMVLKVVH